MRRVWIAHPHCSGMMTSGERKSWYLVADIGGTNARFGLINAASAKLHHLYRYCVTDYPEFSQLLKHFQMQVSSSGNWQKTPDAACLAVAGAVDGDKLQLTNHPWTIDKPAVTEILGQAKIDWINDFAAVGYAIPDLHPEDWRQIGGSLPVALQPIVALGPGTGLGVCTLLPAETGYRVIEGEGGHVDFAPVDDEETAVLQVLRKRFGRVSLERLLSGSGILNIYQALAQLADVSAVHQTPEAVTQAALTATEPLASETLEMFCRVLGATAGNLCLTLNAKGGVYIAGGIVPSILDFLGKSDFRPRFEAKGRFRSLLAPVPVRVIVKEDVGLIGAMKKLNLAG